MTIMQGTVRCLLLTAGIVALCGCNQVSRTFDNVETDMRESNAEATTNEAYENALESASEALENAAVAVENAAEASEAYTNGGPPTASTPDRDEEVPKDTRPPR